MALFKRKATETPVEAAPTTKPIAPAAEAEGGRYSLSPDDLLAGHPDFVEYEVVGESHYQAEIEQLAGGRTWNSARMIGTAVLRAEPTNQYDTNAVRVEVDGVLVGHVKATQAAELSPQLLRSGGAVDAVAVITGGWDRGPKDRGSFGARAWIHVTVAQRLGNAAPGAPASLG